LVPTTVTLTLIALSCSTVQYSLPLRVHIVSVTVLVRTVRTVRALYSTYSAM
jgi:hypothetical protein